MATYYIRKTGSDAAAGTSAGAAWLTIGKALGAAGIASGDTVYVGAGTYRETIAVAMTSATVETKIIADTDGSHTGDVGDVIWTAYTTNDTTTPSTTVLFNPAGRDFLTFENFIMIGANAGPSVIASTATPGSINITFTNCTMISLSRVWTHTGVVDTADHWLFDRCRIIFLSSSVCALTWPTSASADYDVDVIFRNCKVYGATSTSVTVFNIITSGANSFKPGGVIWDNCTLFSGTSAAMITTGASISTTFPCKVRNSIIYAGGGTALSGGAAGTIVEDYNHLNAGTLRTNVSTGANSSATLHVYAPLFEFGQAEQNGRNVLPFMMPSASSPLLGRGSDAGVTLTVDNVNRPRPAGGVSASKAWGALERHDTAISPGTTVGADAGSGYIEIVGMGDHDFDVPVDAATTILNIKVKTSGYSGTNYPQLLIVNGGQCGVADQTINATSASASAYETLSTASFVPTAKGIVTIRLTNRSANGTGIAAFDSFSVT